MAIAARRLPVSDAGDPTFPFVSTASPFGITFVSVRCGAAPGPSSSYCDTCIRPAWGRGGPPCNAAREASAALNGHAADAERPWGAQRSLFSRAERAKSSVVTRFIDLSAASPGMCAPCEVQADLHHSHDLACSAKLASVVFSSWPHELRYHIYLNVVLSSQLEAVPESFLRNSKGSPRRFQSTLLTGSPLVAGLALALTRLSQAANYTRPTLPEVWR